MLDVNIERLNKIKEDAEIFYRSIGEVHCPYIGVKIAFNVKGLDHIIFKHWNRTRSTLEQYMRLKLLRLAPDIIRSSHTLQEFYETNRLERQKINARWEQRLIRVRYYGFVAVINKARVKIVVKEIEGGKPFFWSIIPFWKNRKDEFSVKIKRILHEGDLETQ